MTPLLAVSHVLVIHITFPSPACGFFSLTNTIIDWLLFSGEWIWQSTWCQIPLYKMRILTLSMILLQTFVMKENQAKVSWCIFFLLTFFYKSHWFKTQLWPGQHMFFFYSLPYYFLWHLAHHLVTVLDTLHQSQRSLPSCCILSWQKPWLAIDVNDWYLL